MASGDLTCMEPITREASVIDNAISNIVDTLAATTDKVFVLPIEGGGSEFAIFKVEREA